MSRLQMIEGDAWKELTHSPGVSVLLLSKSDCPACAAFTEELEAALGRADFWPSVRFGKMVLDRPGLAGFKRANPWLAEVDVLPYTVIYVDGEQRKPFAGGGLARLENRLRALTAGPEAPGAQAG